MQVFAFILYLQEYQAPGGIRFPFLVKIFPGFKNFKGFCLYWGRISVVFGSVFLRLQPKPLRL